MKLDALTIGAAGFAAFAFFAFAKSQRAAGQPTVLPQTGEQQRMAGVKDLLTQQASQSAAIDSAINQATVSQWAAQYFNQPTYFTP